MSWFKNTVKFVFTPWDYYADRGIENTNAQTELANAQAAMYSEQEKSSATTQTKDTTIYIILVVVVIAVVAMAIYFKTKGK